MVDIVHGLSHDISRGAALFSGTKSKVAGSQQQGQLPLVKHLPYPDGPTGDGTTELIQYHYERPMNYGVDMI